MSERSPLSACDESLRRTWLLGRLSGHLDRSRRGVEELLKETDEGLIDAVGGKDKLLVSLEWGRFGAAEAQARREEARGLGLATVCRCHPAYPQQLRQLEAPPAVLHILGDPAAIIGLEKEAAIAVVGTRRPTGYGRAVAQSLGRGIAASGLTVVSGMAGGIDSAAHEGALSAPATRSAQMSQSPQSPPTIAVLAGSAHLAYPAGKRHLHRRIAATGAVVSELGPGATARRWAFLARNRTIAALSGGLVVVEGAERSGAMVTARFAHALNRRLGAVPGQVTCEQATGPNVLIARGATLVRDPQDALDMMFGAGRRDAVTDTRPAPTEPQRRLLAFVADGQDSLAALARVELPGADVFVTVAELELAGWLRRGPGGRLVLVP